MDKRKVVIGLYGVLMIVFSSLFAELAYTMYTEPNSVMDHNAGVVFILVLLPTVGFLGGVSMILGFCCRKAEDEIRDKERAQRLFRELVEHSRQ